MVHAMTYAGDRLRQAVEAVVQAMMPSPVYSGAWPGVVTSWDEGRQRAEIAMDAGSPLPRALRGVPALVDPPGTKVTLPNGTPVLVSFRGNNPSAPYFRPAASWGDASVPLPTVGLAGAGPAVARVGDSTGSGYLAWITLGGAPVLHIRGETGPWVPVLPIPVPPLYPTPDPAFPGVGVGGVITSGSSRVTCG
jgi:hypothetical protein